MDSAEHGNRKAFIRVVLTQETLQLGVAPGPVFTLKLGVAVVYSCGVKSA